jgi:phage tail sheath protein FI
VNYQAPDIYIEEVPSGPRPIQAVGTSTAAFVGVAPDNRADKGSAVACNNWTEFRNRFFPKDADGNVAADTPWTHLAHAVFGFFQNGGTRCYVVAIDKGQPVRDGLELLRQIDEVAIVAAPGYTDAGSYDDLLEHCESMKDRVAVLDAVEKVSDLNQLVNVARAGSGGKSGDEEKEGGGKAAPQGLRPRQSPGGYGAFYYPWLVVRDPADARGTVNVPPSGHIAGIWARNDATRGVHKAPANEPVRGALNLSHVLTRGEQALLNPAGINVIRFFAREGILVWGARTVADGASEWRYLNVRRLFNMIEESIAQSTRWIVFEPNDRTLWKSIRRDVSAFLTRLWNDGALMGSTTAEAFFVKCDEETNPPENIDAGIVTTLIGVAPVKPAEFIVFRISQFAGGVEVETEGGS